VDVQSAVSTAFKSGFQHLFRISTCVVAEYEKMPESGFVVERFQICNGNSTAFRVPEL
jgi:hypothetical protein